MRIKEIISQNRRDFTATMVCEHCEHETLNKGGYDDDFYHTKVIPAMKCPECRKTSPENYRPLTARYEAWEVV